MTSLQGKFDLVSADLIQNSTLYVHDESSGSSTIDIYQEVYDITKRKKRYKNYQIEYNEKYQQAACFYLTEKQKLIDAQKLELDIKLTKAIRGGMTEESWAYSGQRNKLELVFQEQLQEAHLKYIQELKSINLNYAESMKSIYYDVKDGKIFLKKSICHFIDTLLHDVELPNLFIYVEVDCVPKPENDDLSEKSYEALLYYTPYPYNSDHPDYDSFLYLTHENNTRVCYSSWSALCTDSEQAKDSLLEKMDTEKDYIEDDYIHHILFQIKNLSAEQVKQIQHNHDEKGQLYLA